MASVVIVAMTLAFLLLALVAAYKLLHRLGRLVVDVTKSAVWLTFYVAMITCVGLVGSGVASLTGYQNPEEVGMVCLGVASLGGGLVYLLRRSIYRAGPAARNDICLDDEAARLWRPAHRIFPGKRNQLQEFEGACRGALNVAAGDSLDIEALDLAVEIKKHVPELIDRTEKLLAGATGADAQRLRKDLWTSLSAISNRAEFLWSRSRNELQDDLEARHLRVRQAG